MAFCILCQTFKYKQRREPSERVVANKDAFTVECSRCGTYIVQGKLKAMYREGLPENLGVALSGLARAGSEADEHLEITSENYRKLAATAPIPRTYADYVDRILLQFAKLCRYPGQATQATTIDDVAVHVYLPGSVFVELFQQMTNKGLVVPEGNDQGWRVRLTSSGWERVDTLQARQPQSNKAFVAMWFADKMQAAFDEGIKLALLACGYEEPFRVDAREHEARVHEPDYQPKIDDRIIAEIRRARFVVADVTGRRPAVYYEAGYAMGLGTPVIWTCREDALEDMCFDTRQFGHILWKDPVDLRQKLKDRIVAHGWEQAMGRRGDPSG